MAHMQVLAGLDYGGGPLSIYKKLKASWMMYNVQIPTETADGPAIQNEHMRTLRSSQTTRTMLLSHHESHSVYQPASCEKHARRTDVDGNLSPIKGA